MNSERIYLCYECHRIVETELRDTSVGKVRVPVKHKDADDCECDGHNGEVITGWGQP